MRFALLAVILATCMLLCSAVDRSKFKTCSQASFCQRSRSNGEDTTPEQKQRYRILGESIQIDQANSLVTAQLKDTKWPLRDPLVATFQLVQNDVVRIRINEKAPKHKRYEVQDVVLEDSLKPSPAGIQKSGDVITVTFGDKSENELAITVDPKPFTFELKRGGKVTMRGNSYGLLNFEPMRDRNPAPQITEGGEGEGSESAVADPKTSAHPYDKDGYWEETFQSHKDSKPRGPSEIAMDISFVGANEVYGIPEHASSLALKTTTGPGAQYPEPYRLYNLDVFEYDLDVPMALYGAIPFMMSLNKDVSNAILWLNAAETFIDVWDGNNAKNSHWISETGVIDLFLFVGPKPRDIFHQYGALTGFGALPAKFAIAYHQCRWNYNSEEDVAKVNAGFDEHDIPMDVIWLDIEHTDGKKYFTWDRTNFPNPKQMQDGVAAKGRKMVTIVDPHIKRESGYRVHSNAQSQGLYVKKADNSGDYEGWCWPGSVSYLDFTQPKVRSYWADQFKYENYEGSTPNLYTWNDMNEPSVFNGPEVTMHKDMLHGENHDIEHREVHNQYGFYQHMATSDGQLVRENHTKRPFVLTRAFFAGSQRYAAMWTGDNKAEWSHLEAAQPMLLSMNIAGFSFSGADVGGFFGNPDIELLDRWYQVGAYQPFFRAHAHIDTKRREPWLFGEPHTTRYRNAIRSRYAILPYLYTTFHENSVNGAPVMRPLWAEFPEDEATFKIDNTFLLGGSLLIRPVTQAGQTSVDVYLPGTQTWFDWADERKFVGGRSHQVEAPIDKIPVFQRAGTIIPKKERARRSSSLMTHDPYTLVIALDDQHKASGQLYIDDGETFKYKQGAFIHRTFEFSGTTLSSKATAGVQTDGSFKTSCTVERIVIYGLPTNFSEATIKVASGAEYKVPVVASERGPNGQVVRKPDVPISSDFTITLA